MKRHKRSILLLVLLLLVALSLYFIGHTYSKYTADVSGTGTAIVAKWAFESDNQTITINVNFDDTFDETSLVDGKIAPGTSGTFEIDLSNENSEVGVDFKVTLGTLVNVPANLKFYKDQGYTTEIDTGDEITGQIKQGDTLPVQIYWKWLYQTPTNSTAGDTSDTIDGEAAKTLSIPVTITGVQTSPLATAITSHID